MLRLAHAPVWLAASVTLILGVVYASLGTAPSLPSPGDFDKIAHFGTYLILALWFTGIFARANYWKLALALVGLGVAMEVLQHAMERGRQGDPLDMGANTLGVAAGVALAVWQTGGWAPRIEAWLKRN
jgi:VanZ family protein